MLGGGGLAGDMASTIFDVSVDNVGTGGGNGDGGAITATVSGTVSTSGNRAAAINVQSIGGGGGNAAFTNSIGKDDKSDVALALSLGGTGGSGGAAQGAQ